jgi:hypothetical protein
MKSYVKYGVIWAVQLYLLAEAPQPPTPAFLLTYEGATLIRGATGQPRQTTSLCDPHG